MADGIYTALSGAVADERRVELLSHNLANMSTDGFRGFRMALESVRGASDEMSFAMPAVTEVDTRPGPITATGNPLDLSMAEGVHFAVRDGDRDGFVRGGTLVVMPDGTVGTEEGYRVLGKQEVINVPKDVKSLSVSTDGAVIADEVEIDRLRLVEFEDPTQLQEGQGRVLFDSGQAAPRQTTATQPVLPGYREEANVNAIQGMTELIAAHRSYDAMSKMIESFSAMEKRTARDMGR